MFLNEISLQYWVGPFLGALLATAFYVILKQYVMPMIHTPSHAHARGPTVFLLMMGGLDC